MGLFDFLTRRQPIKPVKYPVWRHMGEVITVLDDVPVADESSLKEAQKAWRERAERLRDSRLQP